MLKDLPSITRARRAYLNAIGDAWRNNQANMERSRRTYNASLAEAWQAFLQEISANLTHFEEAIAALAAQFDTETGSDDHAEDENLSMPLMR